MSIHNTLAEDILKEHPDMKLSELSFPRITDRDFWNGLDGEIKNSLTEQGKELLQKEFPVITISDFRRFSKDGNRAYFEDKYFARRKMLGALTLAECVEDRGTFIDKILDGLYLILEETTWCLPAHNSYIRDTKQETMPDKTRPIIDLFAAESAQVVGICEYLLRKRLSDVSPFVSEYVDKEIRERILDPYLSVHFWWMGNGLEPMCNWTPWITQNVLLALFSRKDGSIDHTDKKRIIEQAVASVDYFLDEYGDDGCCNEGAQYYEHAGLCLFGCIDVLNRITGNVFAGMYKDERVRNIAAYILKMYVGDGYYINYADCSPFPGKRSVRDYLFALGTENEAYASFAAQDYRGLDASAKIMTEEQNLYYRILQIMHHKDMMHHHASDIKAMDSFFPSVGLLIARDDHYTLAVKAGDNGDSHNHNDVGSITLYKDQRPVLIDLGVETYTAKTFSDRRYEIWTMQSGYHNTLNFAPKSSQDINPVIMQKDGKECASSNTECFLEKDRAFIKTDMAMAYADERIKSVVRSVTFLKNERITVEDTVDISGELKTVMTLMSYELPKVIKKGDGTVDILIGDIGKISAFGIKAFTVETCLIEDERLRIAWKHDCYRILLELSGNTSKLIIE